MIINVYNAYNIDMLKFKDDKFRILIVPDIQIRTTIGERQRVALEKVVEKTKPDLIVLLGDMIFGQMIMSRKKTKKVLDSLLWVIERLDAPFVFVFGNHDMDAKLLPEEQLELYCKLRNNLTPAFKDRECETVFFKDVYKDGKPAVRLLFIDSGESVYSMRGMKYAPASREQMEYTDKILSEKDCPPAMIFQHVPVPEVYDLFEEVDKKTHGAVRGHYSDRDKYYRKKPNVSGVAGEAPVPPLDNSGQFNGWIKSGKVVLSAFGHDHKNSFVGENRGITMMHTSCSGLYCYGKKTTRGARILDIHPDGTFDTEAVFYKDLF